ncbi:flippase [Flavobacterium flavigenum]|uniref:flippase n=1 Tax=Flavobacterium flavigenum TaxID=3003258 RepID=UPI002482FBB2|nr:flippase [Flavobacterium flavigenum]
MSKSLKKNFLLNFFNTVTVVLFPVITFPYASRILMADGIGQINFLKSIVDYVGMFVLLGIPMYGVREVAKVRDNPEKRTKISLEILLLSLFLTLLGYLVIAVLGYSITKVRNELPLFMVLSSSIFLMTIGSEWFYKGVEDFKYITIRGLIVKIISLFLLFFLVKNKTDLMWYAIYNVFGVAGGNFFNLFRLRMYIDFKNVKWLELSIFRHFRFTLHSFALNLFFVIYITLNVLMLGFLDTNEGVGYFSAATKLIQVALTVVSSLGMVMLPRLSNLLSEQQNERFVDLSQKALQFILAISLPISAGLFLLAGLIIPLFCGDSYQPAIDTLKIVSPLISVIGLSSFIGIQILYPQGKEKIVMVWIILSTIINIGLNFLLVPLYSFNGAAIASVVAQLILLISLIFYSKDIVLVGFINSFMRYLFATFIMVIAIWLSLFLYLPKFLKLIFCLSIGGVVYSLILLIFKDFIYLQIRSFLLDRKKV